VRSTPAGTGAQKVMTRNSSTPVAAWAAGTCTVASAAMSAASVEPTPAGMGTAAPAVAPRR